MDTKNVRDFTQKKITIGDVAEALGVSKTTVSRAISGKGRIGASTRERVLKYIEEHNYSPNVIAKGLAQSKTFNIGVALPGDYNLVDLPFFQKCLVGISQIASKMDYDILISMVTVNDISQLARIIANNKVDGVILTRTLVNDTPADFLIEKGVPFVTIGTSLNKHIYQVDNDHRGACKELTSILIMKGMKQIALIGGNESHVVTQNRYNGYVDGLISQGISVNNDIIYMNVDNSVMAGKVVDELMEKAVDCIICMDDSICGYVLNKLRADHIKVPEDIKIASFYNSTVLENNLPSITSLKFNIRELGRVTCRTLLDCIEGKEVESSTLLDYEVVLKESTKC